MPLVEIFSLYLESWLLLPRSFLELELSRLSLFVEDLLPAWYLSLVRMPLPFPATFSARVGMPDCALQDPLLRKFFEMRTEIAWILKVASHAIEHYEHRPEIQRLLVMYFDDNYEHDYIWTTLDSKATP